MNSLGIYIYIYIWFLGGIYIYMVFFESLIYSTDFFNMVWSKDLILGRDTAK